MNSLIQLSTGILYSSQVQYVNSLYSKYNRTDPSQQNLDSFVNRSAPQDPRLEETDKILNNFKDKQSLITSAKKGLNHVGLKLRQTESDFLNYIRLDHEGRSQSTFQADLDKTKENFGKIIDEFKTIKNQLNKDPYDQMIYNYVNNTVVQIKKELDSIELDNNNPSDTSIKLLNSKRVLNKNMNLLDELETSISKNTSSMERLKMAYQKPFTLNHATDSQFLTQSLYDHSLIQASDFLGSSVYSSTKVFQSLA